MNLYKKTVGFEQLCSSMVMSNEKMRSIDI